MRANVDARRANEKLHNRSFLSRWKCALAASVTGIISVPAFAQVPSFPGAVGFGAIATGGRTGSVYIVTNLNDTGVGSFRDAVSKANRIIVFAVGGDITLASPLIMQSNLTIEGQTAPGDGIGVHGAEVSYTGRSNEIARYIRFRDGSIDPNWPGTSGTNSSTNAINLGDTHTTMFDHISAEFAAYNNVDAHGNTGAFNMTFQNSLIADPIKAQQFNFHLEGGGPATFINNVFANSHNRSILAKDDLQFVDNVIYNYQAGFTTGNSGGKFHYDVINNYFITGPSTTNASDNFYQLDNNQSAYSSGNKLDADNDGTLNGGNTTPGGLVALASPWFTSTAALPTLSAAAAYTYDVTHAGPSLHYDEVDSLIMSQVQSLGKKGSILGTETGTGLSNGGYGVINGGVAPTDTDKDGIPDTWETAHGLNQNVADSTKLNPLGYTMVEQWANEIADSTVTGKTWTGTSGEWSTNTANWTTATIPGAYDQAFVQGTGGANSIATITKTGAIAYGLSIGGNGPAAGETLAISGGTLNVYSNVIVGDQNNAALQINSGTMTADSIQLGNTVYSGGTSTTYTGSLLLAGTLQTQAIVLGGGTPGNWNTGGSINWAGGTLQATGSFFVNAPISIAASNAFVDSNGNDGTFSGQITGSGALTKNGLGLLTLSASNNFSGGTYLKVGEVGIATDANIGGPASAINFQGGELQITGTTIKNLDSHAVNWSSFNGGFDVATAGNTLTVNEVIGGTGAVAVDGAGSVILGGSNSFSGGTFLNSGTLQVSADANLGAAGNVLNFNGGTLQINGTSLANLDNHPIASANINDGTINVAAAGNTFTINQSLGGTGGLTKAGPGTLVLSQKGFFTGDTNITGGTLRLGSPIALRFSTVNLTTSGAILDLNNQIDTLGGLSGNRGLDLKGLNLFIGNNGNDTTYSGVLSSSIATGTITKIGGGTLTLTGASTYTGPTTISAGAIGLSSLPAGGVASALGQSSNAAANLVLDGGTLLYTGAGQNTDRLFTLTANGGTLDGSGTGGIGFTFGGSIGMSGTGNRTLTLQGSNVSNGIGVALGDPAGGVTTLATTGTGRWIINTVATFTYSGDTHLQSTSTLLSFNSANELPFGPGKGNLNIDAGAQFEMNGFGLNINGLNGSGNINNRNGTAALTLGNGDAAGNFSGIISDNGAVVLNLIKTGDGLQVLSGTNSYGGSTTVNGGALQFAGTVSIGGSGASVTVNSGGAAAYTPGVTTTAFLSRIAPASTGALALTTVDAATTLNFTTTPLSPFANMAVGAVGTVNYTGIYTPSGTNYRLGGGGGTLTYNPLIAGANNVIIGNTGSAGAVTLANASNSYTGVTTVKDITLNVPTLTDGNANSSMGASTNLPANLVLDGGTFRHTGAATATDRLFTITANGGALDSSGSGPVTYSNLGNVAFAGTGPHTLTLTGSLFSGSTFDPGLTDVSVGNPTSLTKTGSGRWFLAGTPKTYSGDTTVSGGTLQFGAANILPFGSAKGNLVINAGATAQMFGNGQTINGLNGAGFLDNNSGTRGLSLGNGNANATFSGVISGGISLTKTGTGTQILFGATNTYTGTTTVSQGVLNVTGLLAKNDAPNVFIAPDAGAFGTSDDIKLIRSTAAGASIDNWGATETSSSFAAGYVSSASIRVGKNTIDNPSVVDETVTMQWRARTANETPGTQTTPPSDVNSVGLISDPISLTGMANAGTTGSGQTDPFALQVAYDDRGFAVSGANSEAANAPLGNIRLDWLNPTLNGGQWQNAVLGDFGAGITVVADYQGSWDAFSAAHGGITDANIGTYLGSWGVDTTGNTVWAVVNHNSQFAAVPEPASIGGILMAGSFALLRRRRKSRIS